MLGIQTYRDESFDHTVAGSVKPLPATRSAKIPSWEPLCHPRYLEVSKEVNEYFLKHWNFSSLKAKEKFLKADFSAYTCLQLPLAKDDRIHFACRLFTLLFFIDGKVATSEY